MTNLVVVDFGEKCHGRLGHQSLVPTKDDSALLLIKHSSHDQSSQRVRHTRFLHAAIDPSGELFALGNHTGELYLCDMRKRRYSLITKLTAACTCLAFSLQSSDELLVALANYDLCLYNVKEKKLIGVMKGHSSAIKSLSIHGSGRYALTASTDTTILWDIHLLEKKRTLKGAQQVGVQQVAFLPSSNCIISCFKDDSIFVWDCATMKCLYQLLRPPGKAPSYKCLACSHDCRFLVAGGRTRFLHMWSIDSRQITQIIELPEKVKEIKQMTFVNKKASSSEKHILATLAQDGIVRFVDIDNCKLLAQTNGLEEQIFNMTLSRNSDYMICVLDHGDVVVFSLSHLLAKYLRKTEAIVRKVEEISLKKSPKVYPKHKTQDHETPSIDRKKLMKILHGFGEFPAKYRLFIWRNILQLPENHLAFSVLVDKGTHPSYSSLHKQYPIKSRRLLRAMQRVLSALGFWSPIFAEAGWLPMLVFPFIKMFPNNQIIAFEIAATILLNWCQKWFEYFPHPPLSVLAMIETLLAHHDAALLEHLVKCDVTAQTYVWPLLQTLFSEVLTKNEWQIVMDNILANHPSFLLFCVLSYLINARQALLGTVEIEDFKFFFHHKNSIDVTTVIKEAYRLSTSTPSTVDPKLIFEDFLPLARDQYPVFEKYPRFVVDYLSEERERIRQEEIDLLKKKNLLHQQKQETELVLNAKDVLLRQQEELKAKSESHKEQIKNEDKKLISQRARIAALQEESAIRRQTLTDASHRLYLQQQQTALQREIQRLDQDLQMKTDKKYTETDNAIAEAELAERERLIHRRLHQHLQRSHVS